MDELPDLSDLPISELLDTNLEASMRRILTSLDDPDGVISAFQSFANSDLAAGEGIEP